MTNLTEFLVKKIVTNPNDVVITEQKSEGFNGQDSVTIDIKVNPEDTGIVIGKHGQTIKSLRNIIKIKALKNNSYVDIRLSEES